MNERKGLRKEMSKEREWKSLCGSLENDLWVQGYKIAMERLKGKQALYELGDVERK